MTWILLVIIISLIVTAAVVIRFMKGPAYTSATLRQPLQGLLRQGFDGGFLIITVAGSKQFLQFSKYIIGPGKYGLELGFPHAPWSSEYYEKLKSLCQQEGVAFRVAPSGPGDPLEFVFVDFGKDVDASSQFAGKVLHEVLQVPRNTTLYCCLENATIEDRLVDA